MMVEVFKTNVTDEGHAKMLIGRIHAAFINCTANFDLTDCDRILRVVSSGEKIQIPAVVDLLRNYGYDAQVLPDDVPQISEP